MLPIGGHMQEDLTPEEFSRLKSAAEEVSKRGNAVASLVKHLIDQIERNTVEIAKLKKG